ncbi:centrosomal protein of 152 kDa isoform X5 [Colius striatus]|uniref:centrosomal protein of 152 kDa isoform X5 n=1 Tax=Colius striatus TaxID=57412 RepID=UPI002B1D64CE|nr:centrosomal protein of 152 kDa isoform X5 [Colius striatus]
MSLDFDSGALQTQHEDEDYDQEDYAREQELQQLLTDLPHDMLEDSGDQLSSYSDCSIHETEEQSHEPGNHDGRWNDHPLISDPQNDYEQGQNLYPEQFLCDQQNNHMENHAKNWNGLHNNEENERLYDVKEDYHGQNGQENPDDVYLGRDGFNAPSCYQQNNMYHLPENFRPYTNGHKPEFNSQQNKIISFPDAAKEHLKQFAASDVGSGQSPESYKVTYKPYQNAVHQKIPVIQEGTKRNEVFEDLQREFLDNDGKSSENMQILQLQVLNKARERQLEELNEKLEQSAQQIRYLNHQLSMVKDEKDGLAISLRESQKLYQSGKEREVHLEGQIKALETQIQTLTTNEEQILKQSKVAEVAMESMQKQLLELQRSDALQRAREQHEAIVSTLKQKYENQVLALEQKLDTTKSALREQQELCKNLGEHVKQLEKMLAETKCEKTEIINRLTRSLEESQKQCANLLQSGSMQETNQLRFQLQQAQSAHLISNNMNKTLQEELKELKEEIALYESAAKLGVFLNDTSGELRTSLGDSYVHLGIQKIPTKKPKFCSAIQNRDMDKELSKDEIIVELKAELERLLNSNKMKRNQITQLQNDLKDCQKTLEEHKQLLKAEKISKESEPVTNLSDKSVASPLVSDNLKEEVLRLRKANETLMQEVESHRSTIEELKENEEKLKNLNQDLCCQMRKMVQDFDQDKQEAIDRCERTYQQHHEDTKAHFEKNLMERYAAEKQELIQTYEETISQLKADVEELNREIMAVKEYYIRVCREKDTLEATLMKKFEQEQQLKEEKLKKQLLEEKEDSLKLLRTELEEKHTSSMTAVKRQWLEEREEEVALAKVRWEKEEKELALVLSAAEEKWKKEYESTEKSGPKVKELEEKVISLKKELELKKEEIPAAIKAELAKARAQWNKEKQEEILQIQEQNERDYRAFLDDHRSRIKEVLATAKEDLAKQKNDLSIQKEAEIKMLLDQKQREWEAQETKRLQNEINQYEEKTLVELEYLLSEIHEDLVKCTHRKHSWKGKYFDTPVQVNCQLKGKLEACLQKAYRTTVYTILEKKEQEWKEKYEELLSKVNKEAYSCLQCGEGETGDLARPPVDHAGHQAEAQRRLKRQTPLQEAGAGKENEKDLEAVIAENSEMKTKLKDLGTPPREGISKPRTSCDSMKGLEEMRAQYIKAVSKIKCDMLCYIRESKERAAEMIKAEVLRERQETARKMRKYYLTCLQQLLTDNGKHEGAEKKIMDAASKLAAMAKGLETPLRHIPQSKYSCSALPDLPPGAEYSKRDAMLRTRSNHMESKSHGENMTKKNSDKVVQKCVPRDLRQQFDATQTETQHMLHEIVTSAIQSGNNSKNLNGASRDALQEFYPNDNGGVEKYAHVVSAHKGLLSAGSNRTHQNAPPSASQAMLENMHAPNFTNGHPISGPTHMLQSKNERMVLKEDKRIQSRGKLKSKSKRALEFDFQETPERDEGSCSEWSSVNGSLILDRGDVPLLYPEQKGSTNVQAQTAGCGELPPIKSFSPADERVTSQRDISNGDGKILGTKNSTEVYSSGHLITNPEHTSFLNSDKTHSAVTQLKALPDSNAGKCCNKCLGQNGVGSPISSAR